ncbi:MAG: phospholipase C [Gammaproteobacteria bacterium]
MMTSVRDSLKLAGKAASIKQVAHLRNATFPLSMREFVGAPPADPVIPTGRVAQKKIPLKLLQSKVDQIINDRPRPLIQVRLNGEEKKFGQSEITVVKDSRAKGGYDYDDPIIHKSLAKPGERLSFEVPYLVASVTHYFYFQDLRSDGIGVEFFPGPPAGIEIGILFEKGGPLEVKVDGHTGHDIDIVGLIIKLKLEFGAAHGLLTVLGFVDDIEQAMSTGKTTKIPPISPTQTDPGYAKFSMNFWGKALEVTGYSWNVRELARNKLKDIVKKKFFYTNVSVNTLWPDGTVSEKFESTVNSKIFDALSDPDPVFREKFDTMLTRFLVGGDFYVTNAVSDGQSLIVDYIIPPGQLEPFPEKPQDALEPGLLANIDHIVVLMMENRSFDHMLGYLSKEGDRNGKVHTNVDGLKGGETNHYNGRDYPSFPLPDTRFIESPPHGHDPVLRQINNGNMDGFVAEFAKQYEAKGADPGRVMGYHTGEYVPVYDALANHFLICQRWFAAHPGPTFCNRFYTLTGRLNRKSETEWEKDNFAIADFKPVTTRTIFDHLTEHGVSWHFYEDQYCTLRKYERYTWDTEAVVDFNDPANGFEASARAGTLPSVSFIDPNFVDVPDDGDNDDGAPSDIRAGQHLIGRIVNAVMHGPKWNKTLLVITYDEHGGFYDHVTPPELPEAAKNMVPGITTYGVRVPAIVVSPWVDPGAVSNVVFDHTSIAKTIARRFMSKNPPDMGERVAVANDLSMVLRTTARDDMPSIPIPPKPEPNTAIARQAMTEADPDDFKTVMRTLQARYPVRR